MLGGKERDRETAGVVIDELEALAELKAQGRPHPKEDRLNGALAAVGYLRIYTGGKSIRVYFTVIGGVIWMLGLNPNKRRDKLTSGEEVSLKSRLSEVPS